MTIDERLEALTQTLELMAHDAEASRERAAADRERMKRLDARERQAREALMAGIAAYMQALAEGDDEG